MSQVKLIAEPWDVGEGGYQVGNFPVGWTEWNDKYRDTMRAYWKGDGGLIGDFAEAGASYITFHPEASEHVDSTLQLIRNEGCKAGLVFNPATPLSWLEYVLDKIDMALIMSVNPGFGGQSFIPAALDKLREARKIIDASGRPIRLEIDGGVKVNNIGEIAAAGADTFVAGSAVFGADDYQATIAAMKQQIADAG